MTVLWWKGLETVFSGCCNPTVTLCCGVGCDWFVGEGVTMGYGLKCDDGLSGRG